MARRGRAAAGAGRARTWAGTPSRCPRARPLFAGVEDERFYFVHSYGVRDWTLVTNGRTRPPLVTWAEHGGDRFVAAVENGPLTATQFHPEKSGDAGARLLRNWVDALPDAPLLARRARPPGPREQGARPPPGRAGEGGRGRRGRPRRPGRASRPAARPPAGAVLAAAPTSPASDGRAGRAPAPADRHDVALVAAF